ncbi:unnamed protein product [Paramecium sonneborni]|uniref:Uncharacterized protein n=1 Tax=Paramecium sonneborni TaxID=65129 RepID=A0A8S1RQL8_9CILI|nr:unnamed protein product [Paramecium sonneborni]
MKFEEINSLNQTQYCYCLISKSKLKKGDISEEQVLQATQNNEEQQEPVVEELKFQKQKIILTFLINYTITYHKLKIEQKNIKQLETAEENRKLSEIKNKLEPFIYTVREFKEAKYFQKALTKLKELKSQNC